MVSEQTNEAEKENEGRAYSSRSYINWWKFFSFVPNKHWLQFKWRPAKKWFTNKYVTCDDIFFANKLFITQVSAEEIEINITFIFYPSLILAFEETLWVREKYLITNN